jgi:hypothetical protein
MRGQIVVLVIAFTLWGVALLAVDGAVAGAVPQEAEPGVELEPEREPNPFWQDAGFYVPLGAFIALAITDGQQTVYALRNPEFSEGNQLLAGYIEKVGTDGIQPLNIAITAGVTMALTYAWLKSDRLWMKVVAYCAVGTAVVIRAWVVDSNSRLAFE